jgi:hypothetical protein
MSDNDAEAIEEYYEKKFSKAHRRDFLARKERELKHKEHSLRSNY